MLREGTRHCDVCDEEIPKGEWYRAATVPAKNAELFASMICDYDTEMMPTWTQDASGNVRLDVCLECHSSMGTSQASEGKKD